ncbi:hypothetical protein CCR84_14725 [Rhodocyclus purpureus]|nr:hypothetical protein [Rhodocyclus purpureus]
MTELMKGPKQRSWRDQQPVIASPQGVAIQCVGLMSDSAWKPARALSEKNALDCHGATRLAMTELMKGPKQRSWLDQQPVIASP